jgi:peptidoglycan/LPS O-acetylase OafA/YrhL
MALTPTKSLDVRRDLAFSGWLDLFRGLAALAVFYNHCRILLLRSPELHEHISIVNRVLIHLGRYGHLGVVVFFVLSGFLVGGTVIRAFRDGRWSWGKYAIQRGTRLYIVLIPALILTALWDSATREKSNALVPHEDCATEIIRNIPSHTSPAIFAGNLAFLQTITVPSFGSNTPLWSLANEFWYYVLFPLFWIAISSCGWRRTTRIACAIAVVALMTLVGRMIAVYFSIWLLGCLVWMLPEWRIFQGRLARAFGTAVASCGLLLALFVAVQYEYRWNGFKADLLVGVMFAVLLYILKHNRQPASVPALRRITAISADFSYTLYLVHLPPLIFLRSYLAYETGWEPSFGSWRKVLLVFVVVLTYSFVVSLMTERNTDRLRRWLERQVGLGRVGADKSTAYPQPTAHMTTTTVNGDAIGLEKVVT